MLGGPGALVLYQLATARAGVALGASGARTDHFPSGQATRTVTSPAA
jgi:hypothetical protein